MSEPRQSSHVEGDRNHVFQGGRDVRVRHAGDKHRHFSFRGVGLGVLAAALLGGGGVAAYRVVAEPPAGPPPARVADAVGTWELAPSGSVADLPSKLVVGADGAFRLDIAVVFDLPNAHGGLPPMELHCTGEVEVADGRLAFQTTAGPCGGMGASVTGRRLDLDLSSGADKQVLSLVKTMDG
ncbi:hypothetical protein [Saccharothrix obliqua]|uniref:hypothetical protein n=1 Tax=Saccharothrix obliqua TaxID=2861747 RepID=UPI001C5E8F91|nr:hypothetical protein [Saccharothrix obliqua]MBW4719434.1 hypothetical protein [Saccharothrix obliqua]